MVKELFGFGGLAFGLGDPACCGGGDVRVGTAPRATSVVLHGTWFTWSFGRLPPGIDL